MKRLSVSTSRSEMICGLVYILLQIFILPSALLAFNSLLPQPFSASELNFICFAINFIFVTVILHQFLLESIKAFFQKTSKNLRICITGFCLYWLASVLVNTIVLYLDPEFSNVNDDNITALTSENHLLMCIGTIVLVPIVEESLYRGVIFGNLLSKNPVMAYIVSVTVFGALHILGYITQYTPFRIFLCFLQYIPAGIILASTYVKADNIFAPILIHMLVNLIGMLAI